MTDEPLPYHRLARIPAYRWWRPLVELVVFVLLVIVMWLLAIPGLDAALGPGVDGVPGIIKLALTLAIAAPAALLAARIMGRSPGTLSSIEGRLRLRWLGTCFAVSLAFVAANLGLYLLATALGADVGPARGGWVGFEAFLPLAGVVLLVIPLQAAAEEYVFRGTLMQAIGAWVRPAWVAIALSSILFGLAHGLTIEGFVAITSFGAVAAWLTVRTGGLEAAIALHVVNNVGLFLLDAATGRGDIWITELNQDIPWSATIIDVATNVLFGAIIARLHARRSR